MTNTIYFYNINRDDESTSSSRDDQSFESSEAEVEAASLSLYSVIRKACFACATPLIPLEDNISTSPVIEDETVQEERTPLLIIPSPQDVNNLSINLSSNFVPPTPSYCNLKSFSYAELKAATRNFRPSAALEGSFGTVFKGWIDEHTLSPTKLGIGIPMAVKFVNQDEVKDHTRWLAEIKYLGQLCHPNLVRLLGYCVENHGRPLVYEFMPGGSLENRRGLSWSLRMKIALGAAKGLAFLHSANVIYQGFRTSNILLDSDYNAKLSFFRLGMAYDLDNVSTRVLETCAYVAPEYSDTGHLTARSDVYSFGVVLLELFAGRRVVNINWWRSEERNLVEWVRSCHEKNLSFILLGNQEIGNLALRCLAMDAKFRPNMDEVVTVLELLQDSKDSRE